MNTTELWHPWLRINRVLRVMLHTRWSAEAWSVVRVEFRKALALRSQIRGGVVQTDAPAYTARRHSVRAEDSWANTRVNSSSVSRTRFPASSPM